MGSYQADYTELYCCFDRLLVTVQRHVNAKILEGIICDMVDQEQQRLTLLLGQGYELSSHVVVQLSQRIDVLQNMALTQASQC